MNWKNKNVLVTGGSGFIGSHLVEELVKKRANVTCFIKYNARKEIGNLKEVMEKNPEKIKLIFGDIEEFHGVKKAIKGQEIVFHLAANISVPYSIERPTEVIKTNVNGTTNLLEACRGEKLEKVLIISSSEIYGTAQYVPVDEIHPLNCQSPYAASKIAKEKIAESFLKSHNVPIVIIRPFNTYGPRQTARAVIPTIISQALLTSKLKLGNLTPTRDFTFVKDTVLGMIAIAETSNKKVVGEKINLGTESEISIQEVVEKVRRFTGKKLEVIQDKQRIRSKTVEVERLFAGTKKVRKLTGWKPKTTFDEGLKETIKWIEDNIELFSTRYEI